MEKIYEYCSVCGVELEHQDPIRGSMCGFCFEEIDDYCEDEMNIKREGLNHEKLTIGRD